MTATALKKNLKCSMKFKECLLTKGMSLQVTITKRQNEKVGYEI